MLDEKCCILPYEYNVLLYTYMCKCVTLLFKKCLNKNFLIYFYKLFK